MKRKLRVDWPEQLFQSVDDLAVPRQEFRAAVDMG